MKRKTQHQLLESQALLPILQQHHLHRLQDFHWHSVKSQKKWKMRQPLQVHSRK